MIIYSDFALNTGHYSKRDDIVDETKHLKTVHDFKFNRNNRFSGLTTTAINSDFTIVLIVQSDKVSNK